MQRWQHAAVAVLVAAGLLWSPVRGTTAQPLQTAQWTEKPLPIPSVPVQQSDEELRQQLFDAVYQMLKRAGVSRQDMPKEILEVTPIGTRRYRVHMAMVEGDGWFEVYWDGTAWQAKGVNPPPAPPESQAPRP